MAGRYTSMDFYSNGKHQTADLLILKLKLQTWDSLAKNDNYEEYLQYGGKMLLGQ